MMTNMEQIKMKLEGKMEALTEIVNSLLNIREKELPYYNEKIKFVHINIMVRNMISEFRMVA